MERDIGQPARLPGALHTASRGPSAPALGLPNRSPPRPHEPRWTAGPGPHTSPAPLRSGGGRTLQLGGSSTWHTLPQTALGAAPAYFPGRASGSHSPPMLGPPSAPLQSLPPQLLGGPPP